MEKLLSYDFYIDQLTGNTLLLFESNKKHVTLANPNLGLGYKCDHLIFQNHLSNKRLVKGQFLLECDYKTKGERNVCRNIIAYADFGNLCKGIKKTSDILPYNDSIPVDFTLYDLTLKAKLYSGVWLDVLRLRVTRQAEQRMKFQPIPFDIHSVLLSHQSVKTDDLQQPQHKRRRN